jgi:hypothetical protein
LVGLTNLDKYVIIIIHDKYKTSNVT